MGNTNPPTSVLLPTVEWKPSCRELAEQLSKNDELLIICDTPDDPIAGRNLPSSVDLIIAGEPVACSGKANAIAAGLEAASNDRIVWTDDDFAHPTDWLDTLHGDYDQYGPVSEIPFFVGQDLLATLLEPIYAFGGSLTVQLEGKSWAGGVMFDRSDVDVESLIEGLRHTVSDDGLLSEYIEFTTLRRTRSVNIGGTFRTTLERHTRFSQLAWHYDKKNMVAILLISTITTFFCLFYPPVSAIVITALYASIYAYLGVKRWTFLLAYPAMLLQVPLFLYGLWRDTFIWGGRRYRWRSKFDVEVLD
ncbi:glycosyltransferase [Natrialba aegyptia]|uniref:Glycosyl transferase n=1 Tax=Natrialba aegyptia DSM 13077 TaxID=1227491 RepID=M0AQ45_9EURY|nr:glycosyltransferase [Natrialba aegyptia]ELZ00665.1 glycosyl transferase [Natrialba aegyptia DSM 13077]